MNRAIAYFLINNNFDRNLSFLFVKKKKYQILRTQYEEETKGE